MVGRRFDAPAVIDTTQFSSIQAYQDWLHFARTLEMELAIARSQLERYDGFLDDLRAKLAEHERIACNHDLDLRRQLAAVTMERDAALRAFKNFHRLLCERFGCAHDEQDWRRDQLSLIEHIAALRAANRWVPVGEALPVSGRVVLIAGGIGYWKDPCPEYPDGQWFTLTGFDWPGAPIRWNVTHWHEQPLPPGPGSEG